MRYYLRTLGSVSLLAEGATVSGRATQRRRLALLVLLAASGPPGLSRDKLIAYLWPERGKKQCRHALSQALHAIRRQLGHDTILAGVDDLRLNPQVVASDLGDLEAASAAGDDRAVLELYRGPFLDGFFVADAPEFERWAEAQRMRLERICAQALEQLAAEATAAGDAAAAAEAWGRRALLDPLDSAVALALMESLVAAGDRPGALRHAELHAAAVQRELETSPDPKVSDFEGRLRAEAAQDAAAPPPASAAFASPPAKHSSTSRPGKDRGFRRVFIPVAALALLGLLVLLGGAALSRLGSPGESAPRPVVVATVRSSDAVLALAVEEALTVELHSSPDVRVLPAAQVRATLPLMGLASDAVVTVDIAKGVAQRRGVPAVVASTVEPLGTGAQLGARLLDAYSGEVLATVSRRPQTQDEVVAAVASLATELRQRIAGTPLDTARALPAVSTTSLPALTSYALARRAVTRLDRESAIEYAEAALVHDSLFAMAHYLLGDLYWYVDRNRRAQEHLRRAQELSAGLHARERLIIRARYEELVEDRPDSALVYWRRITTSFPAEALGWEGKRWVYRALADWDAMAAAAESAYVRDPDLLPYYVEDRIRDLARMEDSAAVLDFARSVEVRGVGWVGLARNSWAMHWGEWSAMLARAGQASPYSLHKAYVAVGRMDEARQELEVLRGRPEWMQQIPRALLLQARAEATEPGGSALAARELAREALDWVQAADLSPPAYARLAERVADVGARTGDTGLVRDVRALLLEQDGGRGLRSYVTALKAVDAFDALLNDDPATAARLAAEARRVIYYGRSIALLLLLEADARAAAGYRSAADSLYHLVLEPAAFADGDGETLAVLRSHTTRALAVEAGAVADARP